MADGVALTDYGGALEPDVKRFVSLLCADSFFRRIACRWSNAGLRKLAPTGNGATNRFTAGGCPITNGAGGEETIRPRQGLRGFQTAGAVIAIWGKDARA
ncbi:hypothetical protein [Novosphingobium mangrovi (ex Huang et al. 2023)]|uniref:hypothetical protein n=1 Tax=Novosphingobium mangrovi (ex Huang et al. 2023) TaxID=2976432 RepID=UPI0021A4FFC5|nr:hypothetical protein [Novosphingobium mangrovi (ex Huang et al. 2023)]